MSASDALISHAPRPGVAQTQQSPDVPPNIARVLEMITDGFIALDAQDHYVYVNRQAEAMLGYSRKELLGLNVWAVFPGEADSDFAQAVRRARAVDTPVTCENHVATLGLWFENQIYPSPDSLLFVYFRDITQVKRAQGRSHLSMEALRLHERAVDAATNGIIICDAQQPNCPIIYANPAFCTLTGYAAEEVIGRNCRFLQGEDTDPEAVQRLRSCLREGSAWHAVLRNYRKDGTPFWNELTISPVRDSNSFLTHFIGAQADVTEQVEAEHALRQGEAHHRAIVEALAEGVIVQNADGVLTFANSAAERLLGLSLEQMAGRVSADPRWEAVQEDGTDLPAEEHPAMITLRTGQPVRDVMMGIRRPDAMRVWLSVNAQAITHPETSVTHGVVSSFFDITTQREAQKEMQARVEREALLNRIGQALRSSNDPEAIQAETLALLGEALGADRCHFAFYNLTAGIVTLTRDWHRADLPSNQGVYTFPNTTEMFHELHPGLSASVIEDAHTATTSEQTRANMDRLGLRSRLSVALIENRGLMATLTVAMAESPRAWTPEEVTLVEAVASPLRLAVEKANVIQREHRIAKQLQAALQPPAPAAIPGMEIASYYRPAWEDEGVGGDFSDVFGADKGVTFLVVGDVSGKGLSAASEVATVRQMLRFALLNGQTVAGPVTMLNRTLADHELLTGFATLFVGRYDAASRVLTYVNCGQDAGLVLRASTGEIEPLPFTGPVLGAFGASSYIERNVHLDVGDVLALYTDGLTEAGPSRAALLTGDGVAELLQEQMGQNNAAEIILGLMEGVDAHAGSGVRDDQCVIIGVVVES